MGKSPSPAWDSVMEDAFICQSGFLEVVFWRFEGLADLGSINFPAEPDCDDDVNTIPFLASFALTVKFNIWRRFCALSLAGRET